jgi:hypothetical protein
LQETLTYSVLAATVLAAILLYFLWRREEAQMLAQRAAQGSASPSVKPDPSGSTDRVLFRAKVRSAHAQVGLWDAEDRDSYPQWESGEEAIVFGAKGVAVAVAPDAEVDVVVLSGPPVSEPHLAAADLPISYPYLIDSGSLQVGNAGLTVGNEVAGDATPVNWPAGRVEVSVYSNFAAPESITAVAFVLAQGTTLRVQK